MREIVVKICCFFLISEAFKKTKKTFVSLKKVLSFASAYGKRHSYRDFGMIVKLSVSSILTFLQEFNLRY